MNPPGPDPTPLLFIGTVGGEDVVWGICSLGVWDEGVSNLWHEEVHRPIHLFGESHVKRHGSKTSNQVNPRKESVLLHELVCLI